MVLPVSTRWMRRVVLQGFQQHRARPLQSDEMEESVRIEEGRVIAHTYRLGNLFAMWMVPVGLVQFYDGAGNMLQTLDLSAAAVEARHAA